MFRPTTRPVRPRRTQLFWRIHRARHSYGSFGSFITRMFSFSSATSHLMTLMPRSSQYSIYTTSVENWTKILALAQRWGFQEVEQLCIRELEKILIPPITKIQIYQEFKIDRSRLLSSFSELTTRPDPLDFEESRKVGLETALQIARARELSRGSHARPSAVQLQESDLHSAIRNAFGLESENDLLDLVKNSFTL